MIRCEICGHLNGNDNGLCGGCFAPMLKTEEKKPENINSEQIKKAPSIIQKAKSFTKAVTSHTLDGFTNVSQEKQEERLDICRSCEYFDESNTICMKCGCYLVTKTSWRTSECPIGKWGAEEAKTDGGIILPTLTNKSKNCTGCGKKGIK